MSSSAAGISLETDYLVVGAGAMAFAFVDEVLEYNKRAQITIVERRGLAGGHWVDAYDHVKLHQPAIAYGVNSLELSESKTDLSSLPQIRNYYACVAERFLETGRVRFLFKYDYCGDTSSTEGITANIQSVVDEALSYQIQVRRKIVDSGYMRVEVPATHPPLVTKLRMA